MKGNRNDGMGLAHAVSVLVPWWKDLKRCYPEVVGSYFDDEFMRIVRQIRNRIKAEKGRGGTK